MAFNVIGDDDGDGDGRGHLLQNEIVAAGFIESRGAGRAGIASARESISLSGIYKTPPSR